MHLKTLIVTVFAGALIASAQEPIVGLEGVTAHGEAIVNAKPDRFQIDIGVTTQAPTAEAAATQNARQSADVIAAIKKSLGGGADVQTNSYSLRPVFNYKPNSAPVITGYSARNTVQVTSDDLTLAGKVIDTSTKVGANDIQGIQFTLKDEQGPRAEALRQASAKALANAAALAAGVGMKLGRILRISDGTSGPIIPMQREMMMMKTAAAADTPIEAGTLQIRANVSITVALDR